MAEQTKPAAPAAITEDAFKSALEAKTKELMADAGKAGYNPYITIVQKLTPLQERFANGERDAKLLAELNAIKSAPIVNIVEAPKSEVIPPVGGLKLPTPAK
jgi:hypothetical protein